MLRKKIRVFKKDILCGKRGSSNRCPIARAVRRSLRTRGISVNDTEIRRDGTVIASLTRPAQKFVDRFDEFGPSVVRPFSFNIRYTDYAKT